MSQTNRNEHLVSLRRDLHRQPEPAWREFYTTARIIEEVERIGVDELHVGEDALSGEDRLAVPPEAEIDEWFERARTLLAEREGSDPAVLDAMEGGYTGAVAVLDRGEGPTIGLRVDIDGLPRPESDDPEHVPAAEGFRSETGAMHACGHDAHATIGIGVLEAIADSDFAGTFKLFFQPAEEVIGGGAAMANSRHIEDVDHLLAVHIGLNHPTGEVVAGIGEFLAVTQLEIEFEGESAHAGAQPQIGKNANQAVAAAVGNLYAIPRHEDGGTRVNAGVIEGGTASNIVAEQARIEGEVRGETTALRDYMLDRVYDVVDGAATMHGCEGRIEEGASAPSAESDSEIAAIVGDIAQGVAGVDSVLEYDALGGSEDATYLMKAVQDRGGKACYVGIGTDHPGGHHTATFDVDETSLGIGVDVLAGAIQRLSGASQRSN